MFMKGGPVARLEILHSWSDSFDHRNPLGTADSWETGKLSNWSNDRAQRLYQLRLSEPNICWLDDNRRFLLSTDRLNIVMNDHKT